MLRNLTPKMAQKSKLYNTTKKNIIQLKDKKLFNKKK